MTTNQFGFKLGWGSSENNGAVVIGYDAEIRWEQPAAAQEGGDKVVHAQEGNYLANWRQGCTTTTTGAANECTISNLLPGNDYDVRVRANNTVGPGEYAEVGRPVKLHTGPPCPNVLEGTDGAVERPHPCPLETAPCWCHADVRPINQ